MDESKPSGLQAARSFLNPSSYFNNEKEVKFMGISNSLVGCLMAATPAPIRFAPWAAIQVAEQILEWLINNFVVVAQWGTTRGKYILLTSN